MRESSFPTKSGLLFGLGLGGFFDGIMLHQVLQWHHMVSSWYPPINIDNLRLNTLWDGIFHSTTYVFVVFGLYYFWRTSQQGQLHWSGRLMCGTLLLGWGAFNVVEGAIDHYLLRIHHVNETVSRADWWMWDLGFLLWGVAMLAGGFALYQNGKARHEWQRLNQALDHHDAR